MKSNSWIHVSYLKKAEHHPNGPAFPSLISDCPTSRRSCWQLAAVCCRVWTRPVYAEVQSHPSLYSFFPFLLLMTLKMGSQPTEIYRLSTIFRICLIGYWYYKNKSPEWSNPHLTEMLKWWFRTWGSWIKTTFQIVFVVPLLILPGVILSKLYTWLLNPSQQ